MQIYRIVNVVICLCAAIFMYFVVVPAAQAGIFYDAAIKGTYEDNVIGLLSDQRGGYAGMSHYNSMGGGTMMMYGSMGGMGGMGGPYSSSYTGSSSQSKSDTSINVFADLGGSLAIASNSALFLIGSAQHTSYSSYTQFDYTIGGLSTGIYQEFGDVLSGKIAINGLIKRYGDSQRNSSAYGATVSFKEQFAPMFWLKENYDYEQNNADSPYFTYKGNGVGIWAGFLATPRTTFFLGYNYLVRDYDQPSGFEVKDNTLSLGVEQELAKKWFLNAQYSHQTADSNVAGTYTTDNIYSVGLRYSY